MNDQPLRLKSVFKYSSKHFAVVSAVLITSGIVLSMIILYAYLNVFDRQLIWIIDYPDVIRLGLVLLTLLSSTLLLVQIFTENAYMMTKMEGRPPFAFWIFASLIPLTILVTFLQELQSDAPNWAKAIYRSLTLICAFGFISYLATAARSQFEISPRLFLEILFSVLFGALMFGYAWGHSVRDPSSLTQTIYIGGEKLTNVAIVMITSKHIVVYDGERTLVVRADDVLRIVSMGK